MNRKKTITCIVMIFVMCVASCSQAGSIWAKRDKNMKDLYADDKARHIGDILTILITEDSTVDNKIKRNLKKDTERSVTFDGDIDLKHPRLEKILPEPLLPSFNTTAKSDNKLDGKSDYKDERSFIDSITVTVIDIMPNKNLVVMGTRERNIAKDKQIVEISGIVRPSDISFSNTVESRFIADFKIVSKTDGISESFLKPGWLGRFFNWIQPF